MALRKELQNSIGAPELESAILQAVKAAPGCSGLVGVIVGSKKSISDSEPNWDVLGVKFGNADRTAVNDAVATVVTRLQQEFRLAVGRRSRAWAA
jgi:hypothetical protein